MFLLRINKHLSNFFLIVVLHFLLVYFLSKHLSGVSILPDKFFISTFLGKEFYITKTFIYLSEFFNLFLIFVLGNYFFADKNPLLPLLIYSFSPWSFYHTAFVSPYIFFLSIVLLFVLGIILLKENKGLSIFVITFSLFLGILTSLFFLFILPLFWFLFYLLVEDKKLRSTVEKFLIFSLILVFSLIVVTYLVNKEAVFSYFKNELSAFGDPGFINMINTYRGESVREGFVFLSKIVENKYILGFEFIVLKLLQSLTPATFFTSQEKMFGFSFSPPIFLGFLIPFVYGLYKSFISRNKYLILGLVLLLPSLMSLNLINIDRLILFFPVVIYLISYGFSSLSDSKDLRFRFLIILSLFILIFQFLFTLYDIRTKEKERFIRYYGSVQEVKIR